MTDIVLDLENYIYEGDELNIFSFPSPILKKIAQPVVNFDNQLKMLVKNMLFTMYSAPGIGLAAPQVGISERLFVMDIDFEREDVASSDENPKIRLSNFKPMVFMNPVLTNPEGEIVHEEGCLSVPGIYEDVKRAEKINIKYQDLDGKTHSMEAREMLAICLQHENDHLDGILFLERLSLIKKNLLTKKYLKKKKRG